jgi:hypothetical protein
MKGSELQSTSNMLRKLSSDLVKKDKKLAFKVANSIPLADIRSVALSDLGKDS